MVPLQISAISLAPAIVLGVIGGILGALFTQLNVFWCAQREKVMCMFKKPTAKKCARVAETLVHTVSLKIIIFLLKHV